MTGDGTCSVHKKVTTDKAALYATAIQCSSLWKRESGAILPEMGISRKAPRGVIFGTA
jgi:hypothetical protein